METTGDITPAREPDPEAEPARQDVPPPRTVSGDLPLTLLVTAMTAVAMSAVNAAPQLLWIGVVLAPLVTDVLTNSIKRRGWSEKRLLGLTGLITAGGTAWTLRGRTGTQATMPASSAITTAITVGVSAASTIAIITTIELVRGDALFGDRPTTFLNASASSGSDATSRGFRTPEAAISAFGQDRGWPIAYVGKCPPGFPGAVLPRSGKRPGPVMCSLADRRLPVDARPPGRNARVFEITGYDFHESFWLVLDRSGDRWNVDRCIEPPLPSGDTGPVHPVLPHSSPGRLSPDPPRTRAC